MEGKGCVLDLDISVNVWSTIMVNYSTGTLRIATVQDEMQKLVATCESFDLGTDGIKDSSTGVVDGHLIEGARDKIEQSATLFKGKLKEVVVMAESPAQFYTVFWLILAGSAVLCTIRLVGHVWLAVNDLNKVSADHDDNTKGGDRYKNADTEEAIAKLKKRAVRPISPVRNQALKDWKKGRDFAKIRKTKEDNKNHRFCCFPIPRSVMMLFWYFLQQSFILWTLMVLVCPRGSITPTQADKGFMEIFWSTLNFNSSPWGWLFTGNAIIEMILFLGPVLFRWPAWPEKGDSTVDNKLGRKQGLTKVSEAQKKAGTANGDRACLLIACHQSVINEAERAGFKKTLEAALKSFDASSIYVCDNAKGNCPEDTTENLVYEVNRDNVNRDNGGDINYIYVPCGNKTVAIWWTIEFIIPNTFKYMLIIDNDVPLPDPKDPKNPEHFDFKAITEPKAFFDCCKDMDTVGVAYTIKAVPKPVIGEDGKPIADCWGDWLVSMQDA